MIAGIVLVALGDEEGPRVRRRHEPSDELRDPLATIPLAAMYGGVALYLLAQVAFKYRNWHHVTVHGSSRQVLLGRVDPRWRRNPGARCARAATAVMVALIASEAVRYSEVRERVRHEDAGPEAHDSHQAESPPSRS